MSTPVRRTPVLVVLNRNRGKHGARRPIVMLARARGHSDAGAHTNTRGRDHANAGRCTRPFGPSNAQIRHSQTKTRAMKGGQASQGAPKHCALPRMSSWICPKGKPDRPLPRHPQEATCDLVKSGPIGAQTTAESNVAAVEHQRQTSANTFVRRAPWHLANPSLRVSHRRDSLVQLQYPLL